MYYLNSNRPGLMEMELIAYASTCADPEEGTGVRTPLKNHKNKGPLSNTKLVPIPSSQSYQVRPSKRLACR